ncbi:MAG: sigma-70 family RNA polymerase sigma factor [Polyangiaceae bacterium]
MRQSRPSWRAAIAHPPLRLVAPGPSAEPDDVAIVQGIVAGEEWAARVAWNRYGPMVFGFLDRALNSAGETEDLTQEVFLRVFGAARTIRDPTALRSFIYSSAVRMLRWHLRSKRVRRLFMLSDSGDLPERSSPSDDAEGRQLLERFYRLLDSLGTNERTAFVLRSLEGLSLDEIVQATGASLATVKRRIRSASMRITALARLDPELAGYLVPEDSVDEP